MAEKKKAKAAASEATRPSYATVGEMLRAAREAKKMEVEDVSSSIHIRAVLLRALEENNVEALPGMTYAVGFVRSYANFLGLNGAEVVHRFKAEHSQVQAHANLAFPEPVADSRMPDPMTVGVGAFLAVIVLVGWTIYSNMSGGDVEEQIPPAPMAAAMVGPPAAAVMPPTETPAASAPVVLPETPVVSAALPPAAETVVAAPPIETPAPVVVKEDKPAPVVVAAEKKKPEPADAGEEAAEPVINIKRGKTRITLQASQASWIQVVGPKGDVVYRKVLRPGDQYAVPDEPGLSLATANAGGLDVVVDGQPVQSIGKPGEIVRGIVLDPDELKKRRTKVRN